MKRKFGPTATRRLRVESLEARRLLAVAAFQTELYSDNGGMPGQLLVDNTVTAGETFFLRVTAEEFDPFRYGLRTASLDIDWDAVLLDVVESDFELDSVLTADLPLFQSGTLDNAAGRIDELSGTAMLSGGAGRAIGNMRPDTFAMIRMQAGDEAGTVTIQLSKSETKTITVPSMILQDEHLRFEAATVTIVAGSQTAAAEVTPPVEPPAAPPYTDSAELSAPPEAAEVVEIGEATVPPIGEPVPQPASPAPDEPELTEPEMVEGAPLTLDFDANHDGVFDLADFGLLNMQVAAPPAAATPTAVTADPSASPIIESAEEVEEPGSQPSAEAVDAIPAALEVLHTCIPMVQADVVAAEAWLDALAEAWVADAEARRRRRAAL